MTIEQAVSVLRLSSPWTLEDAKKAFKRRARDTHPDLQKPEDRDDGVSFKEVRIAFETLEAHCASEDTSWSDLHPSSSSEDVPDLKVGSWFEVVGVRCADRVLQSHFRAQLVQLQHKMVNRYGEAIQTRWLMAVYAHPGVELLSEIVEVVVREKGIAQPAVFVREVVQCSYGIDGKVSAFWFDPLDEPVISEENVHSHGRYHPPSSYDGYYWWDV